MLSSKSMRYLFLISMLWLLSIPLTAQTFRAAMTVTPVFRPGEILTSIDVDEDGVFDDGDDDFRYVDIELNAIGNIQFWAVNISCSLGRGELVDYVQNASGDDPGDDVPVVTWGPDWGDASQYVAVSTSADGYDFNSGTISLTATRLGEVASIGQNGTEYSTLLATIHLRVATDITRDTTVRPSCRTMEFLDRDGNTVVRGKAGRASSLTIRTGYTVSGTAYLQGARTSADIKVTCDNVDAAIDPIETTTNSRGSFEFGGRGSTLRDLGEYNCSFEGPDGITSFLSRETSFDLESPEFNLLPIILKGGNIDSTTAGSEDDIDQPDLTAMTANWINGNRLTEAYAGRDVNGDRIEDESDLAILAGNFDPDNNQPLDARHLVVGLATETGDYRSSQAYWASIEGGSSQMFMSRNTDQDFFAQLSPDGTKVVVSRLGSRTGNYSLYTIATSNGRASALTPTRNFSWQAFAPSWSPDGQRVAFVCSYLGFNDGYLYNEGYLCVIDADGNNFRVLSNYAKIYPPAWFDDNVIIFGGTEDNATCPDTLCYYDFNQNTTVKVSTQLDYTSSIVVDMPAISYWDHDGIDTTDRVKLLTYRHVDGNNKSLRRSAPTYDNDGLSFEMDAFGVNNHVALQTGIPSTAVSYYSMSWSADLIYYEFSILSNKYETDGNFMLSEPTDDWNSIRIVTVDGYFGTPANQVDASTGESVDLTWLGTTDDPTQFHIQRATVQWVP